MTLQTRLIERRTRHVDRFIAFTDFYHDLFNPTALSHIKIQGFHIIDDNNLRLWIIPTLLQIIHILQRVELFDNSQSLLYTWVGNQLITHVQT